MMYQVKVVGRSTKGPVVEVCYIHSLVNLFQAIQDIKEDNKPFALTEIIIQER